MVKRRGKIAIFYSYFLLQILFVFDGRKRTHTNRIVARGLKLDAIHF